VIVDISQTVASDTHSDSDSVTPPPDKLTNLRVTAHARDTANEIAGALHMDQRALVEGLLELVVGVVRKDMSQGASLERLRVAVLGRKFAARLDSPPAAE
jgi:hypothetical protein